MARIGLHITFLLLILNASSQTRSHEVWILPQAGDTLHIDSQYIEPSSVVVRNRAGEVLHQYSIYRNALVWSGNSTDSVRVTYRTIEFSDIYKHKDPSIIQAEYKDNPFAYRPGKSDQSIDYGKLSTRGNVSRGIGFGNAQDVVVNSNLNLQLGGLLANDVKVKAAISDENNPIQPEGNTQQIQDFDQVYITLEKGKGKLTVGDFLMQPDDSSYFLRYYKKSRGLQLSSSKEMGSWDLRYGGEAAISRGRFNRNEIQGIEGNSGPYRLSGSNNEQFIIVIAGTEKIYLDGKLLSRGEGHDYVINYNTGEVTFTPNMLITRYSRIVAEFQYSDRNYARSVAHWGTSASKGRSEFYINLFNEQDLRSQPFQQDLDGYDEVLDLSVIDILRAAGDQQAVFNNVKALDEYNPDRIMYKRVLVGADSVFEYTGDPSDNTTFYQVYFSNVGFGNGSYVQAQTGANGKVFEYVGDGAGNYAPIEILVAPKRLNTFNLGYRRQGDNSQFGVEYVISGQDNNTLSSINDDDNLGHGLKLYRTADRKLGDSTNWTLQSRVDYELVTDRYQYVERFRTVEFDRQWNKVLNNPGALSQLVPAIEQIAGVDLRLMNGKRFYFDQGLDLFDRQGNYNGLSTRSGLGFEVKNTQLKVQYDRLISDLDVDSANTSSNAYHRMAVELRQIVGQSVIGGSYQLEQSAFRLNDSLQQQSYSFDEARVYLGSKNEQTWEYKISLGSRIDDGAYQERFDTKTRGRDAGLMVQYTSPKRNRILLNTTYRTLDVDTSKFTLEEVQDETLLGRVEVDLKLLKQFVRSRTFYQVGTGQEQRREFQYFQVQAGNGIYIWNDYDSNGIKTLNEFEIASELDRQRADHIKIFTPVDGFFTTQQNKLSQTLELRPAVFYQPKDDDKRKGKPFYARFSSLTSLILDRKVLPQELGRSLDPFDRSLADTGLINSSQKIRTTVFFNRADPIYGLDYSYISNSSKVLLTNGFDTRENRDHVVNTRVNIARMFTLSARYTAGDRQYASAFFTQRNYHYLFTEVEPKIQWVWKNRYRVSLLTKYYKANNDVALGGESTKNLETGLELKFTRPQKGSLQVRGSLVKVDFNGDPGSTLGYELLRGLQNGNNATWNINYQHRIGSHLQVVFNYDGRRSENVPVLHIGRVVGRYLF